MHAVPGSNRIYRECSSRDYKFPIKGKIEEDAGETNHLLNVLLALIDLKNDGECYSLCRANDPLVFGRIWHLNRANLLHVNPSPWQTLPERRKRFQNRIPTPPISPSSRLLSSSKKNLSAAFFRFDTICNAANGKQQRARRLCAAHALAEIFFLIEILLPSASDSAKNKRKRFSFSFSFSSVEHQSVYVVHTFRMLRAGLITIVLHRRALYCCAYCDTTRVR